MSAKHVFASTAAVVLAVLVAATVAWAGSGGRQVEMLDNCDGPSFNAALNDPNACARNGGITFQKFIARLQEKGAVESWRFSPGQLSLNAGDRITAVNRGGEDHTFSEVAHFGGGCIAVLNQILGLTAVPECAGFPGPPGGPFFGSTLAGPGDSVTTAPLSPGIHLFECLIHPWMRSTVTVG